MSDTKQSKKEQSMADWNDIKQTLKEVMSIPDKLELDGFSDDFYFLTRRGKTATMRQEDLYKLKEATKNILAIKPILDKFYDDLTERKVEKEVEKEKGGSTKKRIIRRKQSEEEEEEETPIKPDDIYQ